MGKAKLISPVSGKMIPKKKVAAYCRVSSNSADQLNSYANQIKVYTRLIRDNPAWDMVEIFADEGLSGMKADNRAEFQRMIQMCETKQIDLIVTKSISRFARNVKEALAYVRKLKLMGIGVQFEKEGINTLALGDEMLLSTFTAIAQEESKAISQHQRLSIVKRMDAGEYVDSNAPYGFRLVNKALAVYEPEAEIVRWIYNAYLNGWSTSEIARDLTQRGIPTKTGKSKWTSSRVAFILTNERYKGDCKYQKTYRDTTVPFRQYKNRGQEDMYYATGTHTPLLDAEIFEKVQVLMQQRKQQFARTETQNIYPLTSRIRCSECGSFYRRKIQNGTIKWVCANHLNDTHSCDSFYYSEARIYDAFITMVNKLRFCEEDILGLIISKLDYAAVEYKRNNREATQLSQSIAELNAKLLMLEQLRAKNYLALDVYQSQALQLRNEINKHKEERSRAFESPMLKMLEEVKKLKALLDEMEEPLEEFNEKLFQELILEITVNNRDEMTFTVLGGLKFTELL